jgi:hypothetical protein
LNCSTTVSHQSASSARRRSQPAGHYAGFTALNHSGYYTREIVYPNLTFWGWSFVIWGAAQILAGAVTPAHHEWGAYLGIGLAATSALLWFFMIFAAPFAALLGVTVSMLVVGGFTAGMHPDEY